MSALDEALTQPQPRALSATAATAPPPSAGIVGRWTVVRPAGKELEEFPEGTRLASKYVLGPFVARGGSSVVFRGHSEALQRSVALKIQTAAAAADSQARLRFSLEARLLASITHPSIVRVFEVGELPSGHLACALELLEGPTLRALLDQEGPWTAVRAVPIVGQLLSALRDVHAQGVVHRDIKPTNILLTESRAGARAKLIDFGAAQVRTVADRAITKPSDVVGTPGYIAPEQGAPGCDVDGRADLFALGVVFFELLRGHRPYPSNPASLLRASVAGPPPELTEGLEGLSPALRALLASMLALDPDERPPSAARALELLWETPEADAAEERASPSPAPMRHHVFVVSPSSFRRDVWCRAVESVGAVPVSLATLDAALLLLEHGAPSGATVVLDRTMPAARSPRDSDQDLLHRLSELPSERVRQVIHVVRELRTFWAGADPRARPLAMPLTPADLGPLLMPALGGSD